jgi:hypothetical protein
LPGDDCLRRWAQNLCERAAETVKEKGKDLASEAVKKLLDQAFGEELAALIRRAGKAGYADLVNDLNQMWDEGVRKGFNCERFRR